MRTTPVLSPDGSIDADADTTSMGQGQNNLATINDGSSNMVRQCSSKKVLSSLIDSVSSQVSSTAKDQVTRDNRFAILSTSSSCSIRTESGYNSTVYDEERQDYEGLDEWCSVTTEQNDRDGAENECSSDVGIELKREHSKKLPSNIAIKLMAQKIVKRKDSDDASNTNMGSTRSMKDVAKKLVKKVVKREGSDRSVIKDPSGSISKPSNKEAKQIKPGDLPPSVPKTVPKKQEQKQKGVKTQPATAKDATTTLENSTLPGSNLWTGRIVGLCLPSHVDSDFDSKNKPIDRRVDPTKFLTDVEERSEVKAQDMTDDFNQWKEKYDITNIALDIYMYNQNDPSAKPIKIRMIRDPNEDVSKTLQRLQLSVQKKIGGKKKKQKKGKKPNSSAGKEQGDEAMLLRRKVQVDSAPLIQSVALPADVEAMACTAFWDGFFDAVLPANVCNPWNCGDATQVDQNSLAYDSLRLEENDGTAGPVMKGYERIDFTDSLSINEILQRSASIADLGSYALSVPIASDGTISWTPLMIDSCPPTITSVSTFGSFNESHIFEQTPVAVEVGLLYATMAQIKWFADGEQVCANSPCYTPTNSDVGKILTVVITPERQDHNGKDFEEAYQFKRRVEALPLLPNMTPLREEFLNRPSTPQSQTQGQHHHDLKSEGDPAMSLRVVTYNILADQNASRDVDKDDDADRMYSHCKNEHIVKWRRHPLIIHEILEYSPDVISLQEVDTDVFNGLLKPVLNAKGYEGYYSQKGVDVSSGVREGCAIFWSLDVFESVRPVDMRTHTFRQMIESFSCDDRMHKSQWKSLSDMSDLLDKHGHLKHVLFNKLGHVMQTVVLTQRASQEKVVIGNTHLFYHPMASHIRCLKILMACRQLEIEHKENQNCPIIFCGDLNSHPNSGVMKLMLNRYLDSNNGKTWKHLCTYEWDEGPGQDFHHDVEAIDLEFPSSFPNLMSAYPEFPDFTHFIEAFVCTLDYILVTGNFELEKSGATPTREDIQKFTAMPNECMPSDHVSLVCDMKWR
mmetsp:Transcript_24748/g.59661  ORF Transcript_24748/g.59661 Transcript_24748/m.59661 type:complete len:1020 (+) Transcript_24748:65-3124(+)